MGAELGGVGIEVLFIRFIEFLIVFKNFKCKIFVIKLLKIVYIFGFIKKGKNWKFE